MAFATSVGLGVRQSVLRVSSKSLKTLPLRVCRTDTKSFSSFLLASTSLNHCSSRSQTLGTTRNLSLWGSKPKNPAASAEVPSTSEETANSAVTSSSTSGESVSNPSPIVDSSSSPDVTVVPSDIPSGADIPVDSSMLSDVTEALATHVPAALQYGDLAAMGLASWSPAGIIRWSLELINVSTGLPWFWTIVAGTAFWKVFCLPFVIKGLQVSAKMQPHQEELVGIQDEMKRAREKKDPLALQKAGLHMKEFYRKYDIKPLWGALSIIQLPVTLGIFFGVQKLCNLPLEQLHYSGISLIPDLTVVDSTYALPLLLCALINTQIQVGVKDINTIERPDMAHLMNIFRVFTLPGVYFMSGFPSGLLVALATTAILTPLQTLVLRIPAIRRFLKIPIIPPNKQGRLPSLASTFQRGKTFFTEGFRQRFEAARQEALERQRSARRPPRRL